MKDEAGCREKVKHIKKSYQLFVEKLRLVDEQELQVMKSESRTFDCLPFFSGHICFFKFYCCLFFSYFLVPSFRLSWLIISF